MKLNTDEFFKPKTSQTGQSIRITTTNNTNYVGSMISSQATNEQAVKDNKENDSIANDYMSSYIAIPSSLKFEKPLGKYSSYWQTLK